MLVRSSAPEYVQGGANDLVVGLPLSICQWRFESKDVEALGDIRSKA